MICIIHICVGRSHQSLKAVLIIPYGVLADTEYLQKRSTLILSSSLTVSAILRKQEVEQNCDGRTE